MAGFTACTSGSSYNIFSGNPLNEGGVWTGGTVHPVATVIEWDENTSGYTTVNRVQCGSVKLGGNGVFN